MTSYRLAASLALAAFLTAAATAKVTEKHERLDVNATDVRASNAFNTVKEGAGAIIKGLAKGVIVAIIVAVIAAIAIIIACCVCCCKACAQEKETHTVVYTGAPEQQQFPAGLQQWPPAGPPTQPPQASAPPYSPPYAPPYAPPYPPPYPANQGPPVHRRY